MISTDLIKQRWTHLLGKKIFIGLSGGIDSVVLLRLFVDLGFDVTALHVNYMLRDNESEDDEIFVRKLCSSLTVELFVSRVNTNEILRNNGGNLQEVARTIRYDFFYEFLTKTPNSYIAIAHHKDDQIETFFLNLSRQSGVRGLACMLEEDDVKIRPLLPYSRVEIEQFAKKNAWGWREDSSNKSLKYRRNLLRNKFIPEMEEGIKNIKDSVTYLVQIFQRELTQTQNSIRVLVEKVRQSGILNEKDFFYLDENQQFEILFQLGLIASEIKEFHKLKTAQKGKYLYLSNGFKIFREKEAFSFEAFYPEISFELKIYSVDELPVSFSKSKIYLDKNKVKGEIKFILPNAGDRIDSIGLKGTKLISDVLHDAKLFVVERVQWPILVDEESILACPLITISRDKVASHNSSQLICVEIQKLLKAKE